MDKEPEPIKMGDLNYHPKDVIGRGGFGIVYKGLYSVTPAAIKRVLRDYGDESVINREMKFMKAACNHPNILKYIHHEMDRTFVYIATELCRGTLQEYILGTYNGLKFESEREILFQITEGLAHLHELSTVHRDIKPSNILIFVPDGDGAKPQIKLADFGISKDLKPGKDDYTNTSKTNPPGTRGWMAPEVYESNRFDVKVDIFALGLVFAYTLSAGKHPFGDKSDEWAFKIKYKEPIVMIQEELMEPYSEDAVAFELIKAMLSMKPEDRPTVEKIADSTFFHAPAHGIQNLRSKPRRLFQNHSISIDSTDQFVKLVENGRIDVKAKDEGRGWTALHWLFENYGNHDLLDVVQLLIEKGADVNAKDENKGSTPLYYLCSNYERNNLKDIVLLLSNNGAEVNVKNNRGTSPLHDLCIDNKNNNLIDTVQLLIDKGADVNAKDHNYDGATPLHLLCCYYKKDNLILIIQLLTEKGVDVKAKAVFRQETPLHILCRCYKSKYLMEIIHLMLEKGADVNAKDRRGSTPLHKLCKHYSGVNETDELQLVNLYNYLIEKGATLNEKNNEGETPSDILSKKGIEVSIHQNENIHSVDEQTSFKPLMHPSERKKRNCVAL